MLETPDAPPEDVEDGAVAGHEDNRTSEPLNPVGRTIDAAEEDGAPAREAPDDVPEEFAADEFGDNLEDDEPAYVALDPPGDISAPAPEQLLDAENVGSAELEAVEVPEVPQAPAHEDPAVPALRAEVAALTASLADTQRRADELVAVARRQTEMADELHADNRRLRDGEIREAVAPLVRGLARLADDLGRMRASAEADSEDLAYLAGQVGELLHDAGVLTVEAEVGDPFDPQCHQATGSATTDVTALHRTIAEVRRTGLRRDDGRMLRPVDVVVFRYVAPPSPPDVQPATEEVP